MTQSNVLVALGSNLGDRMQAIVEAVRELILQVEADDFCVSDFYLSRPMGYESGHDYVNVCLYFKTQQTVEQVFKALFVVEQLMGRLREEQPNGYVDRLIDLDLLFFNHLVSSNAQMHLPHPKIAQRDFVLHPMKSININWQVFSVDAQWIKQKLQQCTPCVYAKQANTLI